MFRSLFAKNISIKLSAVALWFAGVSIFGLVTYFFTPAAKATPLLRMASDAQCPVSMQRTSEPRSGDESLLGAFGAALLTSAADSLVDASFTAIKTYLDPSKNQYVDQVTLPHDGIYLEDRQNPDLNCLMIAIFDPEEPGLTSFPFKEIKNKPTLDSRSKIGKMENASAATTDDRIKYLFAVEHRPIVYIEVIRRYSDDGTSYYYYPAYIFVDRMIRPHMLSKTPAWEFSISWKSLTGDTVDLGAFRFSGKAPFERQADEIALSDQSWMQVSQPTETRDKGVVWSPITMKVQAKEFRSATALAEALQKAFSENEDAIKKAIRDGYPWRQKELRQASVEKAESQARQTLETYLSDLEKFAVDCTGSLSPVQQTRCGVSYVKLVTLYNLAIADIQRASILPVDSQVPAPPAFVSEK